MNKVRVKICGITREEDLKAASEAGADAVGFVVGVPMSPRNLSLTKAEKLIRKVPPFVKSFLVTVPRSIEEFSEYEKLNPDGIQIHGENLDIIDAIRLKIPNMILVGSINAQIVKNVDVISKTAKLFEAVLLDSFSEGRYGGTGTIHDWELSKRIGQLIRPKPLILAGGLNSENVAEAVRIVEPYGVDVSSGVEQKPGIKSKQKIIEFIKKAKKVKK